MPGLQRIVVLGPSGAGKTTVAVELAERLGLDHVSLDAIAGRPELATLVRDRAVPDGRWALDGDYGDDVARAAWPHAEALVVLDLPWPVLLGRIARDGIRYGVRRVEPWSGYCAHARWLAAKLARSARQRREMPLASVEARRGEIAPAAALVRLGSTAAVDRWLAAVTGHPPDQARMRAYR